MIRSLVLIGLYLGLGIAWLIAVNADQNNGFVVLVAMAAAAAALGWGIGRSGWTAVWASALIPLILIPLGLLFGSANMFTGGDDTDPVAVLAVFPAIVSILLILVAGAGRILYDHHRRHSPAT